MDYIFTLKQPAASLWFHPHAHHTTATQVYKGLAGAFVIKDDITDTLENVNLQGVIELPSGNYDIPLLIQDRKFNAVLNGQRTLSYSAGGMMGGGMLGDRILVNGVQLPALKVDTKQYRFRIYNASNARSYDFALSDNSTFMVVGTDGGLLNIPVSTDHIKLGAGERAEIVINFGAYTVGEGITLVSRTFNDGNMPGGGMGGPQNGALFNIMRFDVNAQMLDDVVLYTSLPGNPEINTRLTEADTTKLDPRVFHMQTILLPTGVGTQFAINGQVFDLNRVDPEESVAFGATEIWNITNTTGMAHPFHAHAIQWQILSRGQADATTGITIPGTEVNASGIDLGWKDTVLVQPGESVQFIGRFDPIINIGMYMYHCHILEHEDAGMMGMFEILPQSPPL
jgi:blue copper oxidase